MFLGHHAVAFGAKRAAPQVKLGTLIFAAQFLDLLWPLLMLAGVEHVRIRSSEISFLRLDLFDYPFSHSLLTSLIWSVLIGIAYFYMKKNKQSAVVVGCAVFSHWILDFISHAPDLPLAPGVSIYLGLGLWNSSIGTIVFESVLFITGISLYLRATKATNRIGSLSLWTLIAFLGISYISSIMSPPPPNTDVIGWMGLSQWLFVPWGYWIDRNRQSLK